jgi:hypothetical protein
LLHRERHCGGSFPGADHERTPARRFRKVARNDFERVGGRQRGAETTEQQFAR